MREWTTLVLRSGGRLVGAVRGRLDGDAWDIGRLMVAPDLQGRGIGRLLLEAIEVAAPDEATGFVLFTGALQRAQHPDLQEGRLPPAAAPTRAAPGAVRLVKKRR